MFRNRLVDRIWTMIASFEEYPNLDLRIKKSHSKCSTQELVLIITTSGGRSLVGSQNFTDTVWSDSRPSFYLHEHVISDRGYGFVVLTLLIGPYIPFPPGLLMSLAPFLW